MECVVSACGRHETARQLTSMRSTSISSSFFNCWSSSLSSSVICRQYIHPSNIAMIAMMPARHTASRRNTALLIFRVHLCVLVLFRIAVDCLGLALFGGCGLLLLVFLRHVGHEIQLEQAAKCVCGVRGISRVDGEEDVGVVA